MNIAIGCDHAGVMLKNEITSLLKELNIDHEDYGTHDDGSCDYPDFGEAVSEAVSSGKVDRGILICGTGIGMSIVANKFTGVRAALCNDVFTSEMSRLHNDANVLVLPARTIDSGAAKEIIKVWFATSFEGGRHQRRLDKINAIESRTLR